MEQMFLVGNDEFTTILPCLEQVDLYVSEVLKSIIDRGAPVYLRIQSRPALECKLFIAGTAHAAAGGGAFRYAC